MPEERKNIDFVIDEKIKRSLSSEVDDSFSINLMKKIELERQFREEDKKTFNIAKYVSAAMVVVLLAFGIVMSVLFGGKVSGSVDSFGEKVTDFFDMFGYRFIQITGLQADGQVIILSLIIMLVIFLFTFAEKILIKKIHR